MTTETIVAVLSAVLAVGGALWRAMAMLGALERKVDALSQKIDLHVIERVTRVEGQITEIESWRRTVDRDLASIERRHDGRGAAFAVLPLGQLAGDEAATAGDLLTELLPVLLILALAVAGVRGVVSRSGRSRWVYLAGLVAGGALGVGVAIEAGGLWTLGLALGLGASVVVPWALARVGASSATSSRRVPRRPGHDEDV